MIDFEIKNATDLIFGADAEERPPGWSGNTAAPAC